MNGMDRSRLNLNYLIPAWERKIAHPMHEPIVESLTWRDEDISGAASGKDGLGDGDIGRPEDQGLLSIIEARQGNAGETLVTRFDDHVALQQKPLWLRS